MGRWAIVLSVILSACHSAGPYGHARSYVPLSVEEDATADATEYDPVMARRAPDQWKERKISLFGVVVARSRGRDGTTRVRLSMRRLEPRNLCESTSEDSCRVTVSDREYARLVARLRLRSGDDIGEHSLGPGSLVRVVGQLTDEFDAADGTPVVLAEYYRHWPRGFYVTTASRRFMKR